MVNRLQDDNRTVSLASLGNSLGHTYNLVARGTKEAATQEMII